MGIEEGNEENQGKNWNELPVQHVYNHEDTLEPRINIKVEKNSKGFNYDVTVTEAKSVDEAMELVKDAIKKLKIEFGTGE
ncbi:MAG: hypothetical protein WA061_02720 [Microgenomates group bacterium]